MVNRLATAALTIFALASSPFASAQDTGAATPTLAWVEQVDKVWTADGSDAGKASDFYTFTRMIKSSGGEGPLVILSCTFNSRGKSMMSSGFQLDPNNTYEEDPNRLLRTNTMSGKLTVGDDRSAERFVYHAPSSKIIPRDPSVARKLFNAVVKNKPVTLKAQNVKHQIALPPVDDTFKSFISVCPITNGGKMDVTIFEDFTG